MSEMSSNIILVILVTSFATYLSRFLGVVSSEKIDAKSKIFRWFNCIAYAILTALIARIVIFPTGSLAESSILRFDPKIPKIVALAICPVPINPNFIMKNNYLVMPKL